MFALAFLTLYILVIRWCDASQSILSVIITGILGGIAFSVRPDILIYIIIVPITIIFFNNNKSNRINALLIFIISISLILLQMLIFRFYFKSSLPLPFYVKAMRLHSGFLYEKNCVIPIREFILFFKSYLVLFIIIGIDIITGGYKYSYKKRPIELGLLFSTMVFFIYYLFFVSQIMFYDQRFYYPTLPAIIFLACSSIVSIINRIPPSVRKMAESYSKIICSTISLIIIISLFIPLLFSIKDLYLSIRTSQITNFDIYYEYSERWKAYWYKLDEFSKLPDDLTIATTEIGRPSAMNPDKNIIDLTGLNETDFAHNGFSADFLFRKYHPDLIYLPHPYYQKTIKEITNNNFFKEHYEYFTKKEICDALMEIALYRDGKYYLILRNILVEENQSKK